MLTYVDSSVVLAQIPAEARRPAPAFWSGRLVASRLTSVEVYVRLHARQAAAGLLEATELLFSTFDISEMTLPAVASALGPFPLPVRALDAIHLATAAHLAEAGARVEIATYDHRMAQAATALGLPLALLP